MCGILGVLRFGNDLDLGRLEYARDLLAHRGPDGAGLWSRGSDDEWMLALAHRRLSILDLSDRGAQPLLMDHAGGMRPSHQRERGTPPLAMVYNGEIYNYIELRDELRHRGHEFRSSGDTEVLLHAYIEWGEMCLGRLNGMFAFAIWDEARRELFCARDRFGEKPFYYSMDEPTGTFAFASEVKALAGAGLMSGDLDRRAVYRYFRFGEQDGVEQTVWAGVKRLLPAHSLRIRVDRSGLSIHVNRYWDIDRARRDPLGSVEAAMRFGELFRESVGLRLRSDVPVGTSLSGGLDSSSVACQISALGAHSGQKAFSARMDDPALDEGHFIDMVLQRTGITGYGVVPTPDDFLEHLDDLFYHQEEPVPSSSVFASYIVHRLAKEHGVVVMLDGQGADEYLAGYAHYPALVLADLVRHLHLVEWSVERRALRAKVGVDPVPPRALVHHVMRGLRSVEQHLTVDSAPECSCLSPGLAHEWRNESPRQIRVAGGALKSRLYADLQLGHLQTLLRYADRNSMAFSREVRLPFLDHRLVEFTMALPREHVLGAGESKRVLRQAMRGVVPDAILDRRDKVGFVVPSQAWWFGRVGDALRDRTVNAALSLGGLVETGVVGMGSQDAMSILSLATARDRLRQLC